MSGSHPRFSWGNILTNIVNLASLEPSNPDGIADFLTQLTVDRYERTSTAEEANVHANGNSATQSSIDSTEQQAQQQSHSQNSNMNPLDILAQATELHQNIQTSRTSSEHNVAVASPPRTNRPITRTQPSNLNSIQSQSQTPNHATPSRQTDSRSNPLPLYDYPDNERFPNGDICYAVNDPDFALSWATLQYTWKPKDAPTNKTGKMLKYQKCLGIFKCKVASCPFIRNPVQPQQKDGVKINKHSEATRRMED